MYHFFIISENLYSSHREFFFTLSESIFLLNQLYVSLICPALAMQRMSFIYQRTHIPLMIPNYLPKRLTIPILHIRLVRSLTPLTVQGAMIR